MDPTRIVQQGYDDLDDTYRRWVKHTRGGYRSTFLARILGEVPEGADVLEIGCGPGTDAAALAEGRRYVGIDLSEVQLAHARAVAPAGRFVHGDVLDTPFSPASFDAVVSFYAFNHIPQDRMGLLFRRIRSWLRPRGRLFGSFGTSDNPGEVEPTWLGKADMYFSSLPVDRTEALLEEIGFSIEFADTVTEFEVGEGPATFHWVIARKPSEEEVQRSS
ncbi:MAG TPA: class I SAM-dependent methyltransferase [Actinomycetota bacterium]|nr:class I SAM-dependent methyltransferase [Actinomycetota bacterium]